MAVQPTRIQISATELTERGFDPGLAARLAQILREGRNGPADLAALDAAADLLFDQGRQS